jgi:pimeloyl-ACP methyl ester carboxylesterase
MKKLRNLYIILWLLCPFLTKAQGAWASYSTQLPTKEYWGHKFKFSASVKTDELDSKAGAFIWINGHKSTGGITFYNNINNKPITSKEWKTFSTEGVIDSSTVSLAFGVAADYSGLFYFDDMKLEVDTSENTWKTVYANNFEGDTLSLKEGTQSPLIDATNTNFVASLEKKENNQYLKIEGGNIIDFGHNEATGKYADVNGVRLYYEIYGQGQPLVVLHDYETSMSVHAAFYVELMKKHQLILVDMRGQNYTAPLNKTDTLTWEAMATDVNQLMEQLKIDSAHILGVVAGAKVGLLLAKNYPKRVKKLLAYGLFIQSDSTAVNPAMFKMYENRAKQITDIHRKKVLALLSNKEANTIPLGALTTIKIPVFLVSGDKGYILKTHTIQMSKTFPNAQVQILIGGSRNITEVKNDAFLSIIEDFFGG